MTAVGAVSGASDLVEPIVGNLLRYPSPGVLCTVSEEDVGRFDVPTTLVNRGLLGLWHSGHALTKGARTHSGPVGLDEHG